MDWSQSLRLIAPEETLSIASLVLLLVAAWGGDKASKLISVLAVAALVAAGVLVAPALCGGAMGTETFAFYGQFKADAFASFAKVLIYISAAVSLVVAPKFFDRFNAMRAEYPVLVLLATIGMSMMVSATNLITLYIGLEMNSLAAYVLAAFLRTDGRSAEAGLKYFVLGALASGILLYGMSLTYGFAGTTSFDGISASMAHGLSNGALFGLVFVFAGLAFKISAVPFHMWTPDVYEGAPTPVTTLFATAPKVAAMALTMRVAIEAFGDQAHAWQQIIVFAALASIVVGALGAIRQSNIKRLMAYSSINNVGFMLVGLAVATPQGISAMLFYLAIYVAMSVGGFAMILMLTDENGNQVEDLSKMAGLSRTRPGLALGLAMIMFSLAGIPPMFGFWGKFLVFKAAVDGGMIALAALGFAASVIGAFYYLKVVKVMYFDEPADVVKGESDIWHKLILFGSCVVISPLGFFLTKWLGHLADTAAAALFTAL
ncbi:NADH-quinone oxidoreductase subunit NuoN [Sphingomonas sp. IC081]|uniref:NADH-quinone oxidoreductase subunit NuoN n=1 Tax=Sphingomonas sp. IC081 TaxID=304378 RepID=UPI00115AE18A|nr:NADH-quinone oxidoreductase subunit NuoN [Sphingomonas sp. IC081]QDK32737.1 NADH-quinone oxidoreductase subunit NuoN [Sphingomonas sp. IC081]